MKSVFLSTLCILLWTMAANGQDSPSDRLGNHHDSPVYYELNTEPLLPHEENIEKLHENLLTIRHFPPVDVSDFNWARGEIDDYSWWIQVEELRFLLPFIRSGRPEDRLLVKRWFTSWNYAQRMNPHINRARWGEPMTAAYRGMVLVFFLKTEEERAGQDDGLITALREAILEHREFLAQDSHFNADSNHGLVEALGLLEVTRVFPDIQMERLALERMRRIVKASVSERGIHMEHSPVYAFVFLDWLDRYTRYLDGLSYLDKDLVEPLHDFRRRMLDASYYLADHGGTIAQIGDSDSVAVGDRYPRFLETGGPELPPVLFDKLAGYAIYKGERSSGDRRYVVFTNQSAQPILRYHFHEDVLSVLFSYDGETLLGDGGKYEYTNTEIRRYFISPAAHNTIFPVEYLRTRRGGGMFFLVDSTAAVRDNRATSFFGRVWHSSARVERTVVVPARGGSIEVKDVLMWPPVTRREERARFADMKPHYSAMVWNLGPDVAKIDTVETGEPGSFEWILTACSGRKFRLRMDIDGGEDGAFFEVEVKTGSRAPMLGWYSPSLFVMRRRPAILATLRPESEIRVVTRIEPVSAAPFALRILLKGY